jgi:anti-sigma regulatory factor (Ser/Thr protein kinase)
VLQLLTSELVANSARHAGLVAGDRIKLQVRGKRDWIRVEVIDRGRQFEPHVPLSKSSADGSGWGLFVVNQTADRWGIIDRPPNRHVWFELRIPVSELKSNRTQSDLVSAPAPS